MTVYHFEPNEKGNGSVVFLILPRHGDKKVLGYVNVTSDTFTSLRKPKRHLFRSGRPTIEEAREDEVSAWGIDTELLVLLQEKGVKYICIQTPEGRYHTKLKDIVAHGFTMTLGNYPPQHFLHEHLWGWRAKHD